MTTRRGFLQGIAAAALGAAARVWQPRTVAPIELEAEPEFVFFAGAPSVRTWRDGQATSCTGTLIDCQAHGNAARFGGMLRLPEDRP